MDEEKQKKYREYAILGVLGGLVGTLYLGFRGVLIFLFQLGFEGPPYIFLQPLELIVMIFPIFPSVIIGGLLGGMTLKNKWIVLLGSALVSLISAYYLCIYISDYGWCR